MKILLRMLLISIISTNASIALAHTFDDVPPSDSLHESVESLYEHGLIVDDGTHKFRPNDPIRRDFFVSLTFGTGCKKCEIPSAEDIVKYQSSPFPDVTKENSYFYCISQAKEERVSQGYILQDSGSTSCENGKTYQTIPFCPDNTISRIEAAAMLLRRSNLWNDSLNRESTMSSDISDTSAYWYGYAKKGIQIGILSKNEQNQVFPDEKITRGEFARMAERTLQFTQCQFTKDNNSIPSFIKKIDNTLAVEIIPGEWKYKWKAISDHDPDVTDNKDIFDLNTLAPGKWFIHVDTIDKNTDKKISSASITITIPKKTDSPNSDDDGDGTLNKDDLCPTIAGPKENKGCPITTDADNRDQSLSLHLEAKPINAIINTPIVFTPFVEPPKQASLAYQWDFGDGMRSQESGIVRYQYNKPGIYTVTLTVRDTITGNSIQSKITVKVTDTNNGTSVDTDGDGVNNSKDLCPKVKGDPKNKGCPIIIHPSHGNNGNGSTTNTNGSGTNNTNGSSTNNNEASQTNTPGNFSAPDYECIIKNMLGQIDECKGMDAVTMPFGFIPRNTPGQLQLPWTAKSARYSRDTPCFLDKLSEFGIIIGNIPPCNTKNCTPGKILFTHKIRDCDILTPTILNPHHIKRYSQGKPYTVNLWQ